MRAAIFNHTEQPGRLSVMSIVKRDQRSGNVGSGNEIALGRGLLRFININNLKLAENLKPSWYNIAYWSLVLLQIACMCFVFMLRRKNASVFSSGLQ